MKASGIVVSIGALAAIAFVAYAMKGDGRDQGSADAPTTAEVTEATPLADEEMAEPESIEVAADPKPFEERRTTPPSLDELSYDNPIVVWNPDNSVTSYKLARITYPDGTVEERPVKIRGVLTKEPMKFKSARDKIEWKKKYREAKEAGEEFGPDLSEFFKGVQEDLDAEREAAKSDDG